MPIVRIITPKAAKKLKEMGIASRIDPTNKHYFSTPINNENVPAKFTLFETTFVVVNETLMLKEETERTIAPKPIDAVVFKEREG